MLCCYELYPLLCNFTGRIKFELTNCIYIYCVPTGAFLISFMSKLKMLMEVRKQHFNYTQCSTVIKFWKALYRYISKGHAIFVTVVTFCESFARIHINGMYYDLYQFSPLKLSFWMVMVVLYVFTSVMLL
jgi:hypothetical protein